MMLASAREVAASLGEALPGLTRLSSTIVPQLLDSLGSPRNATSEVIDEYAANIGMRRGFSPRKVKCRLYLNLSFAFWSTCDASIQCRAPQDAVLSHAVAT
eukprot:GFKZ01011243.1.p2 GENE.GFKZ01011243.1~~GFKZ01011243.1.p2  ORF type:complete len:101 (-),score=0.80 GFKZ01011243.1:1377-1679(-)